MILAKKFDNALENIGGLFSLPDDVRAVIVFESALYDVASYFSALKNLPAVYIARSAEAENMLSPVVFLKIRRKTEFIYADNEKYVLIDPASITAGKSAAAAFASLSSAIVSLIDYRVRGVFTGEYCSESYNAAASENAPLELLEARIRLAVAETYTDGKILRGGENAVAEFLEAAGKAPFSFAERKFLAALKLIDIYHAFFSLPHGKDMRVPDYVCKGSCGGDGGKGKRRFGRDIENRRGGKRRARKGNGSPTAFRDRSAEKSDGKICCHVLCARRK